MDLAPLVLTALAIIFILQIFTIVQVRRISALVKNSGEKTPETFKRSDKRYRNARDRGQNRKSQKAGTQNKGDVPVSSVEKSLRDINLRLKNAERDQERARKKLGSNSDSDRRRGKGMKRIKRHSRDRKQNQRGTPSKEFQLKQKNNSSSSSPVEEVSLESLSAPAPQEQKPNNTPTSDESFGRGNRITVKRRNLESKLKDETSEQNSAEVSTDYTATETSREQEISFGRR